MQHKTLFKKSNTTGNITQWTVSVVENVITKTWGTVGGKLQETSDTIRAGKNIGRANETTPAEQASLEAKALWDKQLKKGYVTAIADAEAGKTDDVIAGGYVPMLAHRFDKYPDKIIWPAYVQPKLDGHRCTATATRTDSASLWSRTRKPITSMPHIVSALNKLNIDVKLDGELYNHEYNEDFEKLSSLIRPADPRAGYEVVQYHVYDCPRPGGFGARYSWLKKIADTPEWELPLVLVPTILCNNAEEMYDAFNKFVSEGYEGAIIRNKEGEYEHSRSYNLQKVKSFDDAEFEIVGVVEGRGRLAGHGIFVCKTSDGTTFEVKLKGEQSLLTYVFLQPDRYIGRMLTVQYFGITKKSGVPRFPVGLRLRSDAGNGA